MRKMKALYFLLAMTRLATTASATITPATMAFGQLQTQQPPQLPQLPPQGERPDSVYDFMGQASPEKKQMFIDLAIAQIRNFTNPSISVSEDGSLSISESSYDENGNLKLSMVMVQHPFTNANGYEVNNGVLVAPNGTAIFP